MGKSYRDLEVWKRGIALAKQIYIVTKTFPAEELYSLTSQLRRAGVSVPSNIAEGQARQSAGDFVRFLNIAKGSLAELDTQLIISGELEYISNEDLGQLTSDILELASMVQGLISSIQRNK